VTEVAEATEATVVLRSVHIRLRPCALCTVVTSCTAIVCATAGAAPVISIVHAGITRQSCVNLYCNSGAVAVWYCAALSVTVTSFWPTRQTQRRYKLMLHTSAWPCAKFEFQL
jgi:hypothetical protein